MLTVADELFFDALPEETRAVCEKIMDARVEGLVDRAQQDYDQGYARGHEDGTEELGKEHEHQEELAGYVTALEAQLTHHGIQPDRAWTAPEPSTGAPPAA